MSHGKKSLKGFVAKIDDLGHVLIRNQVVKQCHLAGGIADRRRCGFFWQKLRQRPIADIKVESRDPAFFIEMEVGEQSRQQSLANAWTRRCNNSDGAAECHRLTGRRRLIRRSWIK